MHKKPSLFWGIGANKLSVQTGITCVQLSPVPYYFLQGDTKARYNQPVIQQNILSFVVWLYTSILLLLYLLYIRFAHNPQYLLLERIKRI